LNSPKEVPTSSLNLEIVDTDKEDQPKDVVKEASPQKPELWDLNRPLEGDCTMELLPFEDA
jgi:hypothetical protein